MTEFGLKSYNWEISYRTSSGTVEKPVNILHDFYLPVLSRCLKHDRVAGYFRSSSLAAASQGFSAFCSGGGKMRMIVGADLEPGDIQAILQGDEDRFTRRLLDDLGESVSWPENVARGVELLCFMVASGNLDIKAAFRINSENGKPVDFNSFEDGYVHEKWAIFSDEHDNSIYITGSLNESATALTLNAENIDLHADWWGGTEKIRVERAKAEFEILWQNKNPHLRVIPIPEAVKLHLIEIGKAVNQITEIDGSMQTIVAEAKPSDLEILKFSVIRDAPRMPGGRYVGMETAPVKPWPHQKVVARRLIDSWPFSYMLCDEVGLGKTIEAGLAIRSLYLSGIAKRILIAAPASLTMQWHREMADKFFLPFARVIGGAKTRHEYIFPYTHEEPDLNNYHPELCLVSTGLLARQERQHEFQKSGGFDIVLVDEAHYARRKEPSAGIKAEPSFGNLYKTINDSVRKLSKSLWLATATPMQIDWIEAWDLARLTARCGAFLGDPGLMLSYYETVAKIAGNTGINAEEWEFLRRVTGSLKLQDSFYWKYLEDVVIDSRIKTSTRVWIENGRHPKGVDSRNMLKLLFAASPLSRVMLRHTRSLLEIYRKEGKLDANLAKREILPVPSIIFTESEKIAYEMIEEYCRELTEKVSGTRISGKNTRFGFFLSFLRIRFSSSMFAIKETLKRRLLKVKSALLAIGENTLFDENELVDISEDYETDEEVISLFIKNRTKEDLEWEKNRLIKMLEVYPDENSTSSKMKELLEVLEKRRFAGNRFRQTVIFTRFYDTLKDITDRLRNIDSSFRIGTYSGSGKGGEYVDVSSRKLKTIPREQVKRLFMAKEIDLLVCTDAAAEGLNLQTADLLINYDLPWNPMKVEQRIGRIDRIGQENEIIYVLNLCYSGSVEEIVYGRLLKRLYEAERIVGSQQISMLPVYPEDFEMLAEMRITPEELEKEARKRLIENRKRTESMEIPATDLFKTYSCLENKWEDQLLPATLDDIWETITSSEYLKHCGCRLLEKNLMEINGIEGIGEKALLTCDRDLYEKGLPDRDCRLYFASYGDPVFDGIVSHVSGFDLPVSVFRHKGDMRGSGAELFGYSVIQRDGRMVYIDSVKYVNGIKELSSETFPENLIPEAENEFNRALRGYESFSFEDARQTERRNIRAGNANEVFILMIASSLLKYYTPDCGDSFHKAALSIETLSGARERCDIPGIDIAFLSQIESEIAYKCNIPQTGTKTLLKVPSLMAFTAINAAYRIANGIKEKKSDITREKVIARINTRIKNRLDTLYSKSLLL